MRKASHGSKLESLKLALKWTHQSSPLLAYSIIAVSIFGGLISIVTPYLFKLLIDQLTANNQITGPTVLFSLIGILVAYGVAHMFESIFWDVSNVIRRSQLLRIEKKSMKALMEKISSLDISYFEDPRAYNTLSKATQNVWRIIEVAWSSSSLISMVVSVLVIVGALLVFDYRIVLLIVVGALPSIYLAVKYSEVLWSAFSESSPISRHATYYKSLLTEQQKAAKEIKTFRLRDYFLARFEKLFTKVVKTQDKAAVKQLKWYVLIGVIEGTLSVIAAWLVIRGFYGGKISLGDVTFYWALLFQFAGQVRWMSRMISDLNTHALFLTPVTEVLSYQTHVKSPRNPKQFPKKIRKGVEFRNITFYYPRSNRIALRNFNLKVVPGDTIALVGENGSGKTTLIKLLCRLYDVSEGEILIDGVNIKEFRLRDLSENIGVIFQDFMKYDALIEENIHFGKISTKSAGGRIHGAARKSGAWGFIKDLKKQYRTRLGKRLKQGGIELSGGQWQKLAIARAFFKDAPILILDEPTASVDANAEYKLFRRFESFTKQKITFLISHRFSSVRMARKIIFMRKGTIIEMGTHKELLKLGGEYAKMFRRQAEGYK